VEKITAKNTTIAAVTTPPGRGGVGIVRLSGPLVPEIAMQVIGKVPQARYAHHAIFCDENGNEIDDGIALYFPAPASFTGEEVLELQGHGGPVVMDMLMQAVIALGACPARPGEFSERAFINNKLDLLQAEAVADLIDSSSQQAVRSALRSLQGEFSSRVHDLLEQLISLRSYVEAAIDFPDEEIDFLSDGRVVQQLDVLKSGMEKILASAQQGCLLRDGISVVIAGPANAGKSSLMNYLAKKETAIVTDVPGTTRDVLREHISIDGMPLHIIDTAGLRDSADKVEKIGIQRTRQEMLQADVILLVFDDHLHNETIQREIIKDIPANISCLLVHNKIDLSGKAIVRRESNEGIELFLSAKTGQGVELLIDELKKCAGLNETGENTFMARRRHISALENASMSIEAGKQQLVTYHAAELLAEDLRQAQQFLNELTGEFTSEDLLGNIFSSFCIGK